MAKRGCLIALEGSEGVGKTLQSHLLYNRIMKDYPDYAVFLTCEPSDMVRELVTQHEIHDLTRMHLITAGRAETHWTVHQPELEKGGIIITDRYLLSTLCYQNNYATAAQEAHNHATDAQAADVNIVLDMPVSQARERLGDHLDVLEDVPTWVWVNRRANFQWQVECRDDTVQVDALGTREEVHERIWAIAKPTIDLAIVKGDVITDGE